MKNNFSSYNPNILLYLCVFVSLVFGIYSRFVSLGVWSLAADEYYIARSIQNIFERGLPEFTYGGYYTRGLIYQYLSAPFVYFTSAELGLRLVSAISNLFTIVISFFLVKKIINLRAGMLMVILLSLSIWEIEFSRFGRMYSMYQAFFMASIYFMYEYYTDEKSRSRWFVLLFALLGSFTWEGGIFLFPLAVAVTYLKNKKFLDKEFLLYLIPMVFVLAYSLIKFRMMGVEPHFLITVVAEKRTNIPVNFLFLQLLESNWMVILYSFIMTLNILILLKLKTVQYPVYGKFSFGISLLFLMLGFAGLSLCLLFFTLLVWKLDEKHLYNVILYTSTLFIINITFWGVFVYYNSHADLLISNDYKDILKLIENIFNFPDLYRNFIVPWFRVIPVTTGILILAMVYTFYLFLKNKIAPSNSLRIVLYVLLFSFILVGLVKSPYSVTRYSFFFYPLLIINIVVVLTYVSSMISKRFFNEASVVYITLALTGVYILISDDYQFKHLNSIDSYEINYRVNHKPAIQEHYYPRYDYKGAASYINKNANSSDIIITTEEATAYYLNRIDYFFKSTKNRTYPLVATNKGLNERWSTAKLISELPDLDKLITDANKSNKHVWLVLNNKKLKWLNEQKLFADKYIKSKKYITRDNTFTIYYI